MKKNNFLPVLIGIFIPISVLSGEYQATLDMINGNLEDIKLHSSQINQNTGGIDADTSAMKGEVHHILSRVETIDNAATSISGTTLDIRQYLYNICYGRGEVGGWFRSMYDIALDMQTKYNKLVSDLELLYTHVSTTQKYQLDDIKESNQTISDNTTSIKDTSKNIETSTDVIEGHTETIASDTTSISDLLTKLRTIKLYNNVPNTITPSLDKIQPNRSIQTTYTGNFFDLVVEALYRQNLQNQNLHMTEMSSLYNLQAIRTNLNHIAELIESNTNTVGEITVDQLSDITSDVLPRYGIDVSTHDLPNVQGNFTGDFHNDLLKLTRFNASVNISASYASISILTNLQSLLARNADKNEAELTQQLEGGIQSSEKEAEGVEDYIESQQSTWAEYFTFRNENATQHLEGRPTFAQFTTEDVPTSIGFIIHDIKITDDVVTQHLVIEHELSAEEKSMLKAIRSCCTFLVWGVGVFASIWLYLMFIKLLGWACSLINPWAFDSGSNNHLQLSSF